MNWVGGIVLLAENRAIRGISAQENAVGGREVSLAAEGDEVTILHGHVIDTVCPLGFDRQGVEKMLRTVPSSITS